MTHLIADPSFGLQASSIDEGFPVGCIRAAQDGKMYYVYPETCAESAHCDPVKSTLFDYPLRKVTDLVDS